jgi:hypothetical protein
MCVLIATFFSLAHPGPELLCIFDDDQGTLSRVAVIFVRLFYFPAQHIKEKYMK